ncbi:death on curing protein [Gracilibacillus boraciitolerans JCM 21714]|uniref:Death on curing protein n=1 Tax=Gracilibacillus boraciitolerans JCM 21714 TaxID=1298598 RepID=W4VQ45_9BACI|nr:hypothetical protein [Gracilibacillus boraciitolerans]GAE95470.1 death on curing protein [Gracilibacillus boraciitolerans JCM 21714]
MIYLTGEEITIIHYTIMEMYDDMEQAGIKYPPDKFEAMLERPKTELFGGEEQYPSIEEKACCYFHSIARGWTYLP